jgi:hypothetical protein
MSFGGAKFPPLPPLTPPTPADQSTLTAQLQAEGRRSGLRAAMLSRLGAGSTGGYSNPSTTGKPNIGGFTKLSGGS